MGCHERSIFTVTQRIITDRLISSYVVSWESSRLNPNCLKHFHHVVSLFFLGHFAVCEASYVNLCVIWALSVLKQGQSSSGQVCIANKLGGSSVAYCRANQWPQGGRIQVLLRSQVWVFLHIQGNSLMLQIAWADSWPPLQEKNQPHWSRYPEASLPSCPLWVCFCLSNCREMFTTYSSVCTINK